MPRGRPPLDRRDKSVPITVKVPSRHYDILYSKARQQRVSVPELLRRRAGVPPAKRNPK
jgi:hypothetical protein